MHGRVKVRTPAEQAEARKAERLKKIKWYTSTVEKIFAKRDGDELDAELLGKTEELLRVNPDFLTVWNARRKVLLQMIASDDLARSSGSSSPAAVAADNVAACPEAAAETGGTPQSTGDTSPEQVTAGADDGCSDETPAVVTAVVVVPTRDERLLPELVLTVACLMVNPKSYGVWHHRSWVMGNLSKPNWNKEVELCTRALTKDSRNFHCWDYRRFVAQRSTRSDADEVEFTSDKIKSSYSNYSAWHNRGRLLPSLYPGRAGCGLTEEKLNEELDFAKNAMFTDPLDQSAFFYHRWLLGREEPQLAIRCLYVDRQSQRLVAVLNKPMNLLSGSACIVVDQEYELAAWQTANPRSPSSATLVCQLAEGQLSARDAHVLTVEVSFKAETSVQIVHLEQDAPTACHRTMPSSYNMFNSLAASPDVLQRELDSLLELLEINDESDSKWAFLTAVLLLQTLNPVAHQGLVQRYFDSLLHIDTMRSGYYRDLRSRYFIQSIAQQSWLEQNPEQQLRHGSQTLDLSSSKLHGLFHLESWPGLLRLNLCNNKLRSLNGCQVLFFLQELVADDNEIEELGFDVVSIKTLTHLSLRNNRIRSVDDRLRHMASLKHLTLAGNPVAGEDSTTSAIFTMATSLESLVLT